MATRSDFLPFPEDGHAGAAEKLAFVAMLNANKDGRPDALGVVDVDPGSSGYGRMVGQLDMPNAGDELHHFGWNACSACLCPYAPHPHVERRYLIVPGIRSSRIHIVDTKRRSAATESEFTSRIRCTRRGMCSSILRALS